METLLNESIENLSELVHIRNKQGMPIAEIGLLATVYFEEPWRQEARIAAAELAQDYINEFRPHLHWARVPREGVMVPIDSDEVSLPTKWLPTHSTDLSWDFAYHGGSVEDAASGFHIDALGCADDRDRLGRFHISLPLEWAAKNPGRFPEYVLGICKRLKPLSGYGGLGLLESPSLLTAVRWQALARKMGERFPGLEIEDRSGGSIWLRNGIKGVNWLTILGDRWVNEMGGLDYLKVRLGESFYFYPYEGGLMIQAGQKPQIGDVKANRWPELYVTLAKVLKRIQITFHGPMHNGGKDTFDHEATMKWINRFDDH